MVFQKKFLVYFAVTAMLILSLSLNVLAVSSVVTDSHSSTVLNRTMNFNVYLPPSYSTDTTRSYPVMYLLHGMYGSYRDWADFGMQSIVDNAGGKEMVIIMPDGFNSFYVNGYEDDMAYETYMHNELIPYVETEYRIDAAEGKNRAIAGLSMGGFGAAYQGFKYPDKFSSAYAMSGALSVTGNLASVVDTDNYPAFTMECGTEDNLVFQMNESFHNVLQQLGVDHEYITRSGSHSVEFWKECLPKAIVFASNNFTEGSSQTTIGDLNLDGLVNSIDYTLLKRYILGVIDGSSLKIVNADMNKDGQVNSNDYSELQRVLLGI